MRPIATSPQRPRTKKPARIWLDPVSRVEVVTLGERLDGEFGKDRDQALRHSTVVVGVTEAPEREVHRPIERP